MKAKVKQHCDKAKEYYAKSLYHMKCANYALSNYIKKLEGRE